MINLKKVGLTALAGSLAAVTAHAGDLSVTGSANVTYVTQSGTNTAQSLGKGKGGVFDFASANELWRASVETLDFVPLVNASYSGGIIITDWFSGGDNTNRELKITVRFLTNEIRSDALKIIVHEKVCNENNNCKTNLIDSKISQEIQVAILKKAAVLEKNKVQETVEEFKKQFPKGVGKNPNK